MAALPTVALTLFLAAASFLVVLIRDDDFSLLAPIAAAGWLVAHRAPLEAGGVVLSFMPLLPPLLVLAVVSRHYRSAIGARPRVNREQLGIIALGSVLAPSITTAIAIALCQGTSADFPIRVDAAGPALIWTVLVHLGAAVLGMFVLYRRDFERAIPVWVVGGLRIGVVFVLSMFAIGAALVCISLIKSWGEVGTHFEIADDITGLIGIFAVCVGYLPNVIIAGAMVALGAQAELGSATVSLFSATPAAMPALPLSAAFPTADPHSAAMLVLVVVVLSVAAIARATAHWFASPWDALKAVAAATVFALTAFLLSYFASGGQLGALGKVRFGFFIAAGLTVLWLGVVGSVAITLALAGLTRQRRKDQARRAKVSRVETAVRVEPVVAVPDAEDSEGAVPDAETEPQTLEPTDGHRATAGEDDDDDSGQVTEVNLGRERELESQDMLPTEAEELASMPRNSGQD